MIGAIARIATGRRSKWVVLAVWVVLAFVLGSLQPKLEGETKNEPSAFLPESAGSTKALEVLGRDFPGGKTVDAIAVFARRSGLTAADRERIGAAAAEFAKPGVLRDALKPLSPYGPDGEEVPGAASAGLVSKDGTTALVVVPVVSGTPGSETDVKTMRRIVERGGNGLEAHVTGPAGVAVDAIEVFKGIDGTLLVATVSLVLILLLIVYRSPIAALVPLFAVGLSYGIAAGIVYLIVKAGGLEVNGQTTGILIVLMFGAGTDYSLLIVHRFKENLRRVEDRHAAMARAAERTSPPILAAGGTVVASMLVLMAADLKSTASMGPVLALGIAVMIAAGLTLLPATLAILGRVTFWPMMPRVEPEEAEKPGVWRRVGEIVTRRPAWATGAVTLLLIAGALGALAPMGNLGFGEGFREETDSQEGTALLERAFPAGENAPTLVVAPAEDAESVAAAIGRLSQVERVVPAERSENGRLVELNVVLKGNPFSDEETEAVPGIREAAERAGAGGQVLVGGITAQNYDTEETNARDSKVIVPAILILILLILIVLLRALVAPLYLIVTVVLSYGFALGVSIVVFKYLFGQDAIDNGLPLFAFIFLVALGVDYNIFLMSRIREESALRPVGEAIVDALEQTGGVITSAGIILAGTFAVLMILPLEQLNNIGFVVAFGVLVDTFVVRTVLVPAIASILGERNWWPSSSKSHGLMRE